EAVGPRSVDGAGGRAILRGLPHRSRSLWLLVDEPLGQRRGKPLRGCRLGSQLAADFRNGGGVEGATPRLAGTGRTAAGNDWHAQGASAGGDERAAGERRPPRLPRGRDSTAPARHPGAPCLGLIRQPELPLPAGDRPDDLEDVRAGSDRLREGGVRRLVGDVATRREVADEGTTLRRPMVPDGSAQDRITRLQRVQHLLDRGPVRDLQRKLALDPGERPQVDREGHPHRRHSIVWTSTESTGGRCSAIACQLSPESADAYTCPPVVPK